MHNTVQLPYSSLSIAPQLVVPRLRRFYVGTGLNREFMSTDFHGPIPLIARSKELFCGPRLLGLWVRIPPVAWTSVFSVVCCPVEVSATSRSLVQRICTVCVVFVCP
jgi:hypothetical protein